MLDEYKQSITSFENVKYKNSKMEQTKEKFVYFSG